MKERGDPNHSRRRFLQFSALAVTAFAADTGLARVPEILFPTESKITFTDKQRTRLAETQSACLVLGGSNFGSSQRLAEWLTPALEPLGGIGSVEYANTGLNTVSIAKEIKQLKDRGMKEISIYGHSLGTQVAGMVMMELQAQGSDIRLNQLIMDCTPPSLDYTINPRAARAIRALPPDAAFTYTGNAMIFGNPFAEDAASPGLWDEQLEALGHGEQSLSVLATTAARYDSKVSLLTPKSPDKDTIIDAPRSTARMKQLFPSVRIEYVGGDFQQHGVDPKNLQDYYRALDNILS